MALVEETFSSSEDTSTDTDSEGETDVDETFDLEERKVHALCRHVKAELDDISPGIGDRITLANFVAWIRSKSSVLQD